MIEDNQGHSDESLTEFQRSIELLGRLNHDLPGDESIRADLALAHHYLAKKLMKKGSPEEVLGHQRAAIELRKSLAAEFPKQWSHRVDLCSA